MNRPTRFTPRTPVIRRSSKGHPTDTLTYLTRPEVWGFPYKRNSDRHDPFEAHAATRIRNVELGREDPWW